MATKYDAETFLRNIEATLKAKLNAKILTIDTEKADFALKPIDSNAYIFQTLNEKVINYSPTIFYSIDDLKSQGIEGATAETVSVEISIILSDVQDDNTPYRLLRYLRALKELFNDEFNSVKCNRKIIVESLVPIQFQLQNSANYADAIGIKVSTTIA